MESFDTRVAYFGHKCVSLTISDPFETNKAEYHIHWSGFYPGNANMGRRHIKGRYTNMGVI